MGISLLFLIVSFLKNLILILKWDLNWASNEGIQLIQSKFFDTQKVLRKTERSCFEFSSSSIFFTYFSIKKWLCFYSSSILFTHFSFIFSWFENLRIQFLQSLKFSFLNFLYLCANYWRYLFLLFDYIEHHHVLFDLWYCVWLVLTLVWRTNQFLWTCVLSWCRGENSTPQKEVDSCTIFREKSESPGSGESVGSVISCFELKAYSEFKILENRCLGGERKEIFEPP